MTRALVVLVLVLSASPRAFAGDTCVVSGSSITLEEVTVQPPRDEAFQLGLRDVPVTATLPAKCGAPLALDVGGDVAFKASRDLVWLTLTRDVTSADGMVTAKRGAHLIDACMRGGIVTGSAILDADDILPGEHKDDVTVVRGFEVPCDALTLDTLAMSDADMLGFDPSAPATTSDAADTDVAHTWRLRDEEASSVTLHTRPDAGSPGRLIASPNCSDCINLREVKLKKNWVLVERSSEGVTVRGWMLRKLGKREDGDFYGGVMCTGNHGGGTWGEGTVPGSYQRDATVRVGTSVYTGFTNGTVWGTFTRDARIRVRITPNQPWAELRHVSGLDGSPPGSPWLHGWVHLDAVKLDPAPKP